VALPSGQRVTCGVSGAELLEAAGERLPTCCRFWLIEHGKGRPEWDGCLILSPGRYGQDPGGAVSLARNQRLETLLVATGPKVGVTLSTRGALARLSILEVHYLPGSQFDTASETLFQQVAVQIVIEARRHRK